MKIHQLAIDKLTKEIIDNLVQQKANVLKYKEQLLSEIASISREIDILERRKIPKAQIYKHIEQKFPPTTIVNITKTETKISKKPATRTTTSSLQQTDRKCEPYGSSKTTSSTYKGHTIYQGSCGGLFYKTRDNKRHYLSDAQRKTL